MNIFRLWLRALSYWLKEAWPFWLSIVVAGCALVASLQSGTPEPFIRLTGLFLQLLGVGTVAWGIAETRSLFGKPSLIAVSREWVKRFPPFRGRVVSASANIAAGNATVQGRAYVTGNAPAGAPIEARVEVLESNLRRVNERLDQTQRELDEEFRKVNASLKQEEAIRLSEDDLTRRKLEASETGGIHITAMGALWLFVGVTLSTASTEISKWLR